MVVWRHLPGIFLFPPILTFVLIMDQNIQNNKYSTWASEAFEKGGGVDLNREISHTKCQWLLWYKNVRAEEAKLL